MDVCTVATSLHPMVALFLFYLHLPVRYWRAYTEGKSLFEVFTHSLGA